jgi:hypothetical protein
VILYQKQKIENATGREEGFLLFGLKAGVFREPVKG